MTRVDPEIQERVDRLFDRFERMTDAEFLLFRSIWDAEDETARIAAWSMVKVVLRRSRREGMLDQARDRLAAWVNNYNPALLTDYGYTLGGGQGMDPASIRRAGIPPMVDVVAATIASDGLTEAQQTLLLEPIMGMAPHETTGR